MTSHTLPLVSIIVPTTNSRLKYIELFKRNIVSQTYPQSKLELVVVGDTEKDTKESYKTLFSELPEIRCRYFSCDILNNIGAKRNFSCSKASYKILVMMDDDDIYNREYIQHSVQEMNRLRVDIVGCRDMLITWPSLDFETRYIKGKSIHEGTMVFRKRHWKSFKFNESRTGEGLQMVNGNFFNEIDIRKVMICVAHSENTYDKTGILSTGVEIQLEDQKKNNLREILNNLI